MIDTSKEISKVTVSYKDDAMGIVNASGIYYLAGYNSTSNLIILQNLLGYTFTLTSNNFNVSYNSSNVSTSVANKVTFVSNYASQNEVTFNSATVYYFQ